MTARRPVKTKRNRLKIVVVDWYDAHHESGWQDPSAAAQESHCPCSSFGALVYRSKQQVKIYQTIAWSDKSLADPIIIPAQMIQRIVQVGWVDEWGV